MRLKFQKVTAHPWTLTKPPLVQHLNSSKGLYQMIPGTASFWLISMWTLTVRGLNVVERKEEITVETQLHSDSTLTTAPIKTGAKTHLRRLYNLLEPLLPC